MESNCELPDGRPCSNFTEFRQTVVSDKTFVKRAIAEKLLIYATGRRIGLGQRNTVEKVVADSAKQDNGLKSMIHAVVESDLFLAP